MLMIKGSVVGVIDPWLKQVKTGSGGIEKSHSCKWAKWIQWHALPHIQQSTQQWNKGYYPNLHGWDFSIPPSPEKDNYSLKEPGGGFLVQRSIRGRAAEMGLKISLLV